MEDTAESVLGLNFRSLRTLRDLFLKPKTVFQAYAEGDRVSYTPAIRIWLGLIGLQIVFSVFWGGYGELFARSLENSDPQSIALLEETFNRPLPEIAEVYGKVTSFLFAPTIGLMTALSVFVLSAFRKGLPWPGRFNITFGILSAGSVLGLLSLPLLGSVTSVTTWVTVVIFAVYVITFYRGSRGIFYETVGGGLAKAVVYGLSLIVLLVIGAILLSILTMVISGIWMSAG